MDYLRNFDEHCLDNYIKIYNEQNADNKIYKYYAATVCTTNNSYSVLQFQPKAELAVTPGEGISALDSKYNEKVKKFLELSNCSESTYSLVLTPEYSVPLSVASDFIKNSQTIKNGTLFCLCCESVKQNVFTAFIENIKTQQDIEVWDTALSHLHERTLVCCLLYVLKVKFFLEDDSFFVKTFVIPQFKTEPMKDPDMDFERGYLACGERVIEFGSGEQLRFVSVICADVFNLKLINEIRENVAKHKTLIFNPQLNRKPQNDFFRFMRNMIINYSGPNNVRILTLNWSSETEFIMPDGQKKSAVDASWSALYERYSENNFDTYMKVINENANRGVNFAHDYQLAVFFSSSKEHILEISVARLIDAMAPVSIQITVPIKVNKRYVFDYEKGVYVESPNCCADMIDSFFLDNGEFIDLINCGECTGVCSISKINIFLASLFYRSLHKEFEIINDGKITSVTSKNYKSEYSREKLYICKRIIKKMRNREVTKKFLAKDSSFKYVVDKNMPLFNAVFSCGENKQYCRVVYFKYKGYKEIQKIYREIFLKHKNDAENFIIYYEDEDGVHLFEDNVNTEILVNSRPNSAILAGGKLQ